MTRPAGPVPDPGGPTGRTVIVVANQTLGTPALTDAIERLRTAEGQVHLVVPIKGDGEMASTSPPRAGGSAKTGLDISTARKVAEQRLTIGLDWIRTLGLTASGELAPERDTVDAVERAAAALEAAHVVVSTLPTVLSRWLRQDLPRRIERKVDIPVTVVVAPDGY
jgi:hypothetical protein